MFNTPFTIFLDESSQYTFATSTASFIDTLPGISSVKKNISANHIYIGNMYDKLIVFTLNLGVYFFSMLMKNHS
ncbi:MAG: hypothetical protein Q8S84_02935 [bacterium]|nr:hypothetical protein [bacterium]